MILGFYNLSFTSIDDTNFSNAMNVATVQSTEALAKTGLSLSLMKMGNDPTMVSFPAESFSVNNGSVTIRASQPVGFPASQTQVVATATIANKTVTMTSTFQYHNNRWKLLKSFSSSAV